MKKILLLLTLNFASLYLYSMEHFYYGPKESKKQEVFTKPKLIVRDDIHPDILETATNVFQDLINSTNIEEFEEKKQKYKDAKMNIAFEIIKSHIINQPIDDYMRTRLHKAVLDQNLLAIEFLHRLGANLNYQDSSGTTPLMLAVKYSTPGLKKLISLGAKVNMTDKHGRTPLMIAIKHKISAIQPLLNAGANINASNKEGLTPLIYAALHNPIALDDLKRSKKINYKMLAHKIFKYFINYTKNIKEFRKIRHLFNITNISKDFESLKSSIVNQPIDIQNNTSLHKAALKGDIRAITILYILGANLNVQNSAELTPLALAAANSTAALHQLISLGADANIPNKKGMTPLMFAVVSNRSAIEPLLKAGANVNAKNNRGRTALMLAIDLPTTTHRFDNPRLNELLERLRIEPLLKAGANVNIKDHEGISALMLAAQGDILAIEPLLQAGAQIDARDRHGNTPLIFAAAYNTAAIEPLLRANANVNVRNNEGNSALMLAAAYNRSAIEPLINAGANKNIKNKLGQTALDLALITNSSQAVIDLLK